MRLLSAGAKPDIYPGSTEKSWARGPLSEEGRHKGLYRSCADPACFCCQENSTLVQQQQLQHQQLLAAYADQQQQIALTSGALCRARADALRLTDVVESLKQQLAYRGNVTAREERAHLQTEALRDRLNHLKVTHRPLV